MRISRERKQIIAWRVAKDWIDFAVRILDEGKKPVKFSDHVGPAIHHELCELCERKGDIEMLHGVSDRVKAEIRKMAIRSCKVQVSMLKKS